MDTLPSSNITPKLLSPDSNMIIHKWQIRLLDVVGQGYITIIIFGPAHESVYWQVNLELYTSPICFKLKMVMILLL